MSDEVYEGAIGIDLGKESDFFFRNKKKKSHHIYHNTLFTRKLSFAKTSIQAQPTPASPTMKAPTLRSVCFFEGTRFGRNRP